MKKNKGLKKEEENYNEGYNEGCEDTIHALIWILRNRDINKMYVKECKKN